MLRDDLSSRKSFKIAGVGRVIRPCKLVGKHASHRLPVYLLLVFQQLTASWISSFSRFLLPFHLPISSLLYLPSFSSLPLLFPSVSLSSSSSEDSASKIVRLPLPLDPRFSCRSIERSSDTYSRLPCKARHFAGLF